MESRPSSLAFYFTIRYSPAMSLLSTAKDILSDTLRTCLELFKIMIPIIVAVKIIQEFGVVHWVALPLEPFMGMVGLPAEMGLVWATAILSNLYGAMVVYAALAQDSGTLSTAQITVLCTMMLIAHNLAVELRVAQKCGTSLLGQLTIRLVGALACGFLMHQTFTLLNLYSEPSTLVWTPAPADPSLIGWALDQVQNLVWIACIVLGLIALMRILNKLRITDVFQYLLGPVLRFLGMGKSAAATTVIGLTMGLAVGGGLIMHEARTGRLERRDVFPSLSFMGLFHSLIEDTLLMLLLGAHLTGILWGRLLFSLVVVAVLVRIVHALRAPPPAPPPTPSPDATPVNGAGAP